MSDRTVILTGKYCHKCKYYRNGTKMSYQWCVLHDKYTSESGVCADHSDIKKESK